jgi:hypothetical protein
VSSQPRLVVVYVCLLTIGQSVSRGYKIEFSHLPFQSHYIIQQNCFSFSERESISGEVKKLLAKGAIKKCSFDKSQFIPNLFLVPKKSGEMSF